MNVLRLIFFALLLLLSVPWPLPAQTSLEPTLTPFLSRFVLLALAAAVVKNGEILAAGAVGTRRGGTNIPVTINDRFHLGSNTNAITFLLAARLVEEGKLRWDSTVVTVFPELSEKMDPEFRKVTLEQLFSHTGGLPSDNETFGDLLKESISQEGNLDELRYWMVGQWSRLPLASKPGTAFAYSNMGYTIVGAMFERVSGKTWDEENSPSPGRPIRYYIMAARTA